MFENKLFNNFYQFGETVLLLLYVNALWICFTLLGLIIFGLGPSTVAMYTIFRHWAMGRDDLPVFKTFWETFKREFLKANILGVILLMIAYMLYVNWNFLELDGEWITAFSQFILLVATVIYGVMLIYIFPIYVQYENKLFVYFKNAILMALYQPFRTLYAIAACLTLYYIFFILPVFIFLMGASLSSFVLMWITYRTFMRLEYKQAKLQEKQA
ncbi:YesL family protein [Lederbergia galactosidilytica]|uniref:DUF624 domain-containing protein n=2 Tax=Lederbergia galactosidilytica TaxID=217031 RepID=A0A177ZWW1_9BACI|nr:DUF624 domain-containing protein [Lederbergia galactosidilytica]OAK71959.1 hypothetical protein ABB05_10000 [Lederbergia galactosidilytica]